MILAIRNYEYCMLIYVNQINTEINYNQKMALLVTVIFDPDNLLESFVISFSCFSHLPRSRLFPVRYSYSSLSLNCGPS